MGVSFILKLKGISMFTFFLNIYGYVVLAVLTLYFWDYFIRSASIHFGQILTKECWQRLLN